MRPLLSVCMIVKNEENVLERCLESLKGIPDEIIIVDTGSQDQTKEIALRYTDKVFDFVWVNDFSKARNYAASKATGEWILVIDADEYVERESFKKFKRELKDNPPEHDILSVQIVSFVGNIGRSTSLNYHERLYRNNGLISYYRPVHEMLTHKNPDENTNRGIIDLQLFHSGYLADAIQEKNKSERNLSLLLSNNKKEAIDYFFIGNEYKSLGELDKAIRYYQKAYNLKSDINLDWVKKLLLYLVDSLHKKNRDDEALDIIQSCEKVFPNIVDFKFFKGIITFNKKQYRRSKRILEDILENKETLVSVQSLDFLELLPLKYLGKIYEKENELHKAVESYSKALSINEADDQLWINLIFLLGKYSTLEELATFLNNNVVNRKNMTPQRVLKILLSVPLLNVQKLSRSLLNESQLSEVEKEALLIKNLHLDGQTDDVINKLENKTLNELIAILATGNYNITDLIIIVLETNNERCKELLLNIKFDHSLKHLMNMLFNKKSKKLTSIEEDFFISIYRQAHVLGLKKVLESLNGKKAFLSKNGKEKISEIISDAK